jgi:excisionase family DNA binding protein
LVGVPPQYCVTPRRVGGHNEGHLLASGLALTDRIVADRSPRLPEWSPPSQMSGPVRLPPLSTGRAPKLPARSAQGVMQPAVQRLTPIGLSPVEAAQFLGTSRSRVYRLLREGRLVALKQGVATIVTMESLTAYVGSLPAATFRPAVAA